MKDLISFADFSKMELRVGKVVEAKIPEGSEHLIELRVSFGEEGKRTIFAGIKKWYSPEELVGKRLLFVANMEPKKTPFGESEGMLLAADGDGGKPELIEVNHLSEGVLLR